jgi:integrase
LAGAGYGLHIIGALLGHTQPSTTHRYSHLTDDPLRAATERAGAILSGQPSAEVVPFNKGGR